MSLLPALGRLRAFTDDIDVRACVTSEPSMVALMLLKRIKT